MLFLTTLTHGGLFPHNFCDFFPTLCSFSFEFIREDFLKSSFKAHPSTVVLYLLSHQGALPSQDFFVFFVVIVLGLFVFFRILLF